MSSTTHYAVAKALNDLMPEADDLPSTAFETAVNMIVEAVGRETVSWVLRATMPVVLPKVAHEVLVDFVVDEAGLDFAPGAVVVILARAS